MSIEDGVYTILADNSHFWRAYGLTVNLDTEHIGDWDRFTLKNVGDGRYTIQDNRGYYMKRFGDEKIELKEGGGPDSFSYWIITEVSSDMITVMSPGASQPYVARDGDEGLKIFKLGPDQFCKFTIKKVG